MYADWVAAVGVIAVAAVVWTAVRWRAGRRRNFRITLVIEHSYEGIADGLPHEEEDS